MFDPEQCTPDQYEQITKTVRLVTKNPGGVEGRCIAHGLDSDIMEGCIQLLATRGDNSPVDIGLGFLLALAMLDYKHNNEDIVI